MSSEQQKPAMAKKKTKAKKKKPLGMKAFFPTAKNFQGFDKHRCRYEESIKDHVFVPKKYGELSQLAPWRWEQFGFCPHCKLSPCVTVEHFDEIFEKACTEHKKAAREDDNKTTRKELAIISKIEKFVMRIMTKHFGRDYIKRTGTPECVIKESHTYTCDWHENGGIKEWKRIWHEGGK